MRFNNASKDEMARRNAAKAGVTYCQTKDTKARWRARELADEAFARGLGVRLCYDEIRLRVGQVSR